MEKLHHPEQIAPVGTYVLEVFEKSTDPAEPRNSPNLHKGNYWFRLSNKLFVQAEKEKKKGSYVSAFYVVSDDQTRSVSV